MFHCPRRTPSVVLVLSSALVSIPATASFTSEGVSYTSVYTQAADNTPPTSNGGNIGMSVSASSTDATSVTVTTPTGDTYTLSPAGGIPPSWKYFAFPLTPDVASHFPNGTYTAHLSGGSLGTASSGFSVATAQPQTPTLTGTSISDLKTVNTTGPITVTFNGFSGDPAAANSYIHFAVSDPKPNQGFPIYEVTLSPSDTSVTIPGNTLQPDTTYEIDLQYYNLYTGTAGGGSPNFRNIAMTEVDAIFQTAVVPEPACLSLWAAGCALLLRRKRQVVRAG